MLVHIMNAISMTMSTPLPIYVAGKLSNGATSQPVRSPGNGEIFAHVAWANTEQTDQALSAAQDAVEPWARTSIGDRVMLMHKLRGEVVRNREALREAVMFEVGKTWAESEEDVDSLADSLEYYADEILRMRPETLPDREGTHRHELRFEAVGVVVAFLAWNFPLLNLGFKLGPALAAGCPIIIKSSPKSPVSAYLIGQLCEQVGFPPGAVNILCGPDDEVAVRLASSTIPALLTLIGSAVTGRRIARAGASSIKRYSMELGGNAPVILEPDADLDRAVDVVAGLKFGNAGQICVAPNRVLVHNSVRAEFARRIAARAGAVQLGFGRDTDADMGPVIDDDTVGRLTSLVADAQASGARLLAGGGKPSGMQVGSFFAPTVLDDVRPGMTVYESETFGPIVSIVGYDETSEAIRLANGTDAGLVAYVFSRDIHAVERMVDCLRFGEVQVNGVKYAIDLPHGGIGQSGLGHDCSHLALRDYLITKRVSTDLSASAGVI